MRRRLALLAAFLLAALLIPGPLAAMVPDACSNTNLPYVLNIGLPRLPDAPELQADALKRDVRRLVEDFYAEHGRCPERQLQVNITVASDYEILDWLSQGTLDAAIVPDLTVYLLERRDGLALQELDIANHLAGGLFLPALRSQPHSGQLAGGQWQARPDPRGDYKTFLDRLWDRARRPPDPEKVPALGDRVVLASHLSTPGFLVPVTEAARDLAARLPAVKEDREREAVRERFWQAFFANARFAIDCDTLLRNPPAGARSCWLLPDDEEAKGEGPVEILYPGESVLRRIAGPGGGGASGDCREHLVITATAAAPIFDGSGLAPAAVHLEPEAEALFGAKPPLPALAPMLDSEPTFGVRTFGFTLDEAFRLLRQDQATSGVADLALVLPGGGVKAAYQSTVVDALYQRGYLKNFKAAATPGSEPLDVQYVIGTSGGALLGFFVSQLGEKGPRELAHILWHRDGGGYVRSTDIFAWTDLLRYLSVIASFLVLCGLLALLSVPERAALSPAPQPVLGPRRSLYRGVILPVLFLAPLLVRWVSGDSLEEQVPEFEGFVYAILAMIAMVADQALIRREEEREGGAPWIDPALPLAAGGALVILPLLPWDDSWVGRLLAEPVTFGPAFAVLAPLLLLGGLILPLRAGLANGGPLGYVRPIVHLLVSAGFALSLAFLLPSAWLDAVKLPFFLAGLLLALVCIAANLANLYLKPGARAKRRLYFGALGLSSLLLLTLCWPEQADPSRLMDTLRAQTLDVTVGTFLLCIGLLVLMLGGLAGVYAKQRLYHLQLLEFLKAYAVTLLHAVAVYTVLLAVIRFLPDWLSPLELTGQFWLWLLGTSLVLGALLLLAALGRLGGRQSVGVAYLRRSFQFLCSHHPNADAVTRRFLRIAAFSVGCLLWWNLVLAPALYGNKPARRYLESAARRFEEKAHRGEDALGYRPTARFIAPANLLEKDGTRYFLFVPPGDDCPAIPKRPASGARWFLYEARLPGSGGPQGAGCSPVPDRKFLHQVIFASGSPFPIFPAHRLVLDGQKRPLVDGGYTNNVPVDVALNVAAGQVLIVDSTNPLGHPSRPGLLSRAFGFLLGFRGKLVENLGRLPGFLFERSQQVDRLSRRDLFVVSLSPSREEPDWPALFDFRPGTVQRMEEVAGRDLGRRIGLVESWGRPRFQLSVLAEGKRQAGEEREPASAPPATPGGR